MTTISNTSCSENIVPWFLPGVVACMFCSLIYWHIKYFLSTNGNLTTSIVEKTLKTYHVKTPAIQIWDF
jgi:hypothetical protein